MMSNWSFSYADSNFYPIIEFYNSSTQPSIQDTISYGLDISDQVTNLYICPYLFSTNPQPQHIYYSFYTNNNHPNIIFFTDSPCSVSSTDGVNRKNFSGINNVIDGLSYYYKGYDLNSYYNINSVNAYVYNNSTDCIYAFQDFISNPESARYPYTFQNGYLFVYDLGSSDSMYSFDLTSTSMEYSDIGSNPFPDTNQAYWFSNSLPEMDVTTIPDSSAAIIHWGKGSDTNIFGQTKAMVATISGTSSGRYLYIYNPPVHYKWSGNSNPTASEVVNYPVTIDGVSSGDNFYIYDSVARLYDFNQGGKIQGTVVGDIGYGSVASNGAISVTTTNGAIYSQTAGGSTDISGASGGSIAENIRGLQETLDNFVNQFVHLLSAPISHIQQLIQSGENFFSFFNQLFDWLPTEVSSVIASALIVMIVIGVLKMLL